jgi:hypothetical protein
MRDTVFAVLAVAMCASVGGCRTKNDAAADAGATPDAGVDAEGTTPGGFGDASSLCPQSAGNAEVPGNGCDDDGDGKIDNAAACDEGLPITGDASAFARALDLCQTSTGADDPRWGVVSVEYKGSFSKGTPAERGQTGILSKFGDVVRPRGGSALGVLSTGFAREYDDVTPATMIPFNQGAMMQPASAEDDAPPGFPKASGVCPINSKVRDFISVKLRIKVPANAHGMKLDFDFWSGEWPRFVCSDYNDAFVAYLTSRAFNGGVPDNISFDAQENPVSVNNGFFDRCTPGAQTGCNGTGKVVATAACSGGEAELGGTGFLARDVYCAGAVTSGGGATGWLTSTAPVEPGEILTLELMIWDTGDQNYDSSVLLDHFEWLVGPTQTGTDRPPR